MDESTPIYKTTTKDDGTYIFDLSEPVVLATGKTASFKPSEGQNFLVRTWTGESWDNEEDIFKFNVVKNGDMYGGAFHNRLTRKQESWDFTVGIERIVNANIQFSEKPTLENWLMKPEKDWVRPSSADGRWEDIGNYGYTPTRGDIAATGTKVVASYVNDEVARKFDEWKKQNPKATAQSFKVYQKQVVEEYNKENEQEVAVAETVVETVDAKGDYYIPFRVLYGVSRDKMNSGGKISWKVTNDEYGKVVKDQDLDNKALLKWNGTIRQKHRHINHDYMYVYPIIEDNARQFWMKMFETNIFQTMDSIGGIHTAGNNMNGVQFVLLAPRPLHDVTNYDAIKNFASVGSTPETKTVGLVPNMNYKLQWFRDGKPLFEAITVRVDEMGEIGNVPFTVDGYPDEELTKPARCF